MARKPNKKGVTKQGVRDLGDSRNVKEIRRQKDLEEILLGQDKNPFKDEYPWDLDQ